MEFKWIYLAYLLCVVVMIAVIKDVFHHLAPALNRYLWNQK